MSKLEDFYVPLKFVKEQYILLDKIGKLLTSANIIWWIDGGNLLSWYRYGMLQPWDDDLDFGILEAHYPKLVRLVPEIESLGYKVVVKGGIFKICTDMNGLYDKECDVWHYPPCLDIFLYKLVGGEIVISDPVNRKIWPDAKHKVLDFFPLVKVKLGDIEVFKPKNGIPYLDGTYKGWRDVILVERRNRDGEKVDCLQFFTKNLFI